MGRQVQHNKDPGRVGVLAATQRTAESLAQEFRIYHPICLSPRALTPLRGNDLRVLLVHEDSWPLRPEVLEEIRPALKRHAAYAYKLCRHDPYREQ